MSTLSRVAVLCTRCQAFGLLQIGGVCPICDGAGVLPRLSVRLRIVSAADLDPPIDLSFKRMVVTLAQRSDDGSVVVVRGVTELGIDLVASLPAARYAAIAGATFTEADLKWPR